MGNTIGAYALYEFLKELVENGELKATHDNSEVFFYDDNGVMHPITDYSFDNRSDLIFW